MELTAYVYVCPKCGRPHSTDEFKESRFCRHCGKFLADQNRRVITEKGKTKSKKVFKLQKSVELSIEKTYELIQQEVPLETEVDSLEVVKQVEEYRQFWKPKETNVALLAESHVYTAEQDFKTKCERSILRRVIPDYPINFVRFVYCLGYGENELLNRAIKSNSGTWQFWRIFSSCVGEDEMKVLKMGTSNLEQRLRNKTNVLRKMRNKGVWLLDSSIVGLTKIKRDETLTKTKKDAVISKIIRECWDNHLEKMIQTANPKHVIVIGTDVEKILRYELKKLNIPYTTIDAPQRHLSSQEQQENYEKYQRICARYT